MSFNVKDGGVWRSIESGYVKVSGAWQEIQSAWVKDGGVWRKVYDSFSDILFPDAPYSATHNVPVPAVAVATISFRTDGTVVDQDSNPQGQWVDPLTSAPGDYQIRANSNSPDTPDSGTMDLWLPLSQQRSWSESRTGGGTDSKSFTVDLRIGSGPVLGTAVCNLTAIVS